MGRMRTGNKARALGCAKAALGILAAIPLVLAADFICTYTGHELRVRFFAAGAVLVCALFAFAAVKLPRVSRPAGVVLLCVYALAAVPVLLWLGFRLSGNYECPDPADKAGVFAGRDVMLIVPHEDDELNLLGGVIEELVSYKSTLRVVFTTNGDYHGIGEGISRIRESVAVLTELGVPEENVIFLGYSDSMSSELGYFYDLEDANAQVFSARRDSGATYGAPEHGAYNEGSSFSRAHLLEDMKGCILKYRPDTLICVDHDSHRDHKAASLLFEEAMGAILSENADYKPLVLKAFAYSTAFFAPPDFYESVNLRSTARPCSNEFMDENHAYIWAERLRLPVSAGSLSRSMLGSGLWRSIGYYQVLDPFLNVKAMLNGDRVFWPRSTESLTYSATVTASSGAAEKLSDFRLGDNYDILGSDTPMDGLWVPSEGDGEPWISVSFDSPEDVSCVRLYDAPSLEDNILRVTLSFDNGSEYRAGPLAANGSATDIAVDERGVSSFRVSIDESVGAAAGLTELEAYARPPRLDMKYIKLTDAGGDFVYDYITGPEGREELCLYAVGAPEELSGDNYTVSVENDSCAAALENGRLRVVCPRGEETVLCIRSADGSLSDSVYIRNPRLSSAGFWMRAEERAFNMIAPTYRQTATGKILRSIYKLSHDVRC